MVVSVKLKHIPGDVRPEIIDHYTAVERVIIKDGVFAFHYKHAPNTADTAHLPSYACALLDIENVEIMQEDG